MDQRLAATIAAWDWDAKPTIPSTLPLLDAFRHEYCRYDFQGWDVLMIQHHLGTFLPLVDSLLDDGMSVERSWHLDIPYSTNLEVNNQLRRRWSRPDQMLPVFADPLSDFSEAQLLRVALLLSRLTERAPQQPLLIIDDGAYFLRGVLTLRRLGIATDGLTHGAVVVEQTTRGHRFLHTHRGELEDWGISAVSIARSQTKQQVEAPCIGACVAAAITRRASAPRRVLVLGYGVIGAATLQALSTKLPDAELFLVDSAEKARESARAASSGRWTVLDAVEDEGDYNLVVGCTGVNSFKLEHRHLLADGAALASGSSAALEFDRAGFVELADLYPDDEIEILNPINTRESGIHADIKMRIEGSRTLTVLNAGFPINFDGAVESLSTSMIQATRCLLYAAAGQAAGQRGVPPVASGNVARDRPVGCRLQRRHPHRDLRLHRHR